MKNSLENKIKYDYEQGTKIPSSNLWDKLDAKLDIAENKIVPEKSIEINWWKYAAILLCLITFGIIFKYSFQDESGETQTISKVKTPKKPLVKENTSIAEIEKIEEQQQTPDKIIIEKVPTKKDSNLKITEKSQKFTSNTHNLIQNKKPEIQLPENFEEKRIVETPIVEKQIIKNIANNQNKVVTEKTIVKYVKADELLFGRELQKDRESIAKNKNRGGFENSKFVKIFTPSNIKILGITVYSEDQSK